MFKFLDKAVKYQKCCCYFPIGKGLRAWGILKTVLILSLIVFFAMKINQLVYAYYYVKCKNKLVTSHIVLTSIVLGRLIFELIFHVFFMIGVFKKCIGFLKIYEKHSTILMLTSLSAGVAAGIFFMSKFNHKHPDIYSLAIFIAICAILVTEFYINMLVTHTIRTHESLPAVVCVVENSEAEDEYTMRIEIA